MNHATAQRALPRTLSPDGRTRVPTPQVTLVVAAAGYGKSAWVESHKTRPAARTLRADQVFGPQLWALGHGGAQDPVPEVVIEDLHRLDPTAQRALLDAVARLTDVRLTLTSRLPLGSRTTWSGHGPVLEIGPRDLAMSPQAVATLLEDEYGVKDPELPHRVHTATAGWPALVHLAADALVRRPHDDLVAALGEPGSAAVSWVHNEILAPLPVETVDLLGCLVGFDVLTPDLLAHLGADQQSATVTHTFTELVEAGLLVRHPRAELLGRDGHRMVPLLRAALAPDAAPLGVGALRLAAEWYEANGHLFAAVDAHQRGGCTVRALDLLARRGSEMIANGDAAGIVTFLTDSSSDTGAIEASTRRTLAEALHVSGQSYAALGAYAPLKEAADQSGWDEGLAARVAAVHFSQGDLPQAVTTLDKVPRGDLSPRGDGILWRATRANVASMLGGDEDAHQLAEEALRLAHESGCPGDLTAAHQAVARTTSGSRKAAHLRMAMDSARQAGDAVSMARILGNQSYALLAATRCEEAVAVSREAVRATELVRPMGALTAALHNLAEALTRTGEYAEARQHLRRAVAVSQRLGPNRAAASLCGLGEVHRTLGHREQARAAYEESIRLARASQELQVLVPALAGLARALVEDTPDVARTLAEEARALAPRSLAPFALIALGWVEIAAGDQAAASHLGNEAAALAREEQELDLLAEALELCAETEHPVAARASLAEALSIWREGGADPDASRIEVLLAALEGADRADQVRGREAAERLRLLGMRRVHGRDLSDDASGRDVAIAVIGRFEVVVGGRPVPLQAWRSRQARTLVKILAGRRGRPLSRAHLAALLWPDAEPAKTSHRLSVLLTTVRAVLDPAKSWPADHYLSSDDRGVWLDPWRVSIDADELLADAEHGAALLAAGDTAAANGMLLRVDARYQGGAFEDETDEWALDLHEEVRGAWLRSLRHLATVATREGRSNDASSILARLIAVDPYDERVHRGLVRTLVRAGRHGEARRALERWTEAMLAIDAPPPDPDVLIPVQRRST